jgi:hypothetical protein
VRTYPLLLYCFHWTYSFVLTSCLFSSDPSGSVVSLFYSQRFLCATCFSVLVSDELLAQRNLYRLPHCVCRKVSFHLLGVTSTYGNWGSGSGSGSGRRRLYHVVIVSLVEQRTLENMRQTLWTNGKCAVFLPKSTRLYMSIVIVWVVMPCSLVGGYKRF